MDVAIVDYGMGNLDSVARAVAECGGRPRLASAPSELRNASAVILPGVGAFAAGMRNLHDRGFVRELDDNVRDCGVPVLGLCLGMHLLAREGEEGGATAGLGWIDASVSRLDDQNGQLRIPHIGWNTVRPVKESPLFLREDGGRDFYFVHSYELVCRDEGDVVASTDYGHPIAAAVHRENVFGVQFHPEKSQKAGFQLLRNFLAFARKPNS